MATAKERVLEILRTAQRPILPGELVTLAGPPHTQGAIWNACSVLKSKGEIMRVAEGFIMPGTPAPVEVPRQDALEDYTGPEKGEPTFSEVMDKNLEATRAALEAEERTRIENREGIKRRVMWNEEERGELVFAAWQIKRDNPLHSLEHAVFLAQRRVFPEHKRRDIRSFQAEVGYWLRPMFDTLNKAAAIVAAQVPPRPAEAPLAAPQATPEQPPVPAPPPPVSPAQAMLDIFKSIVREAIEEALGAPTPQPEESPAHEPPPGKHDPTPTSLPREVLPRFYIFGLQSKHRTDMKNEYKGKADLRFGENNEHGAIVKQQTSDVDKIVVMLDGVGHGTTDMLKREQLLKQAVLFHGGNTRLRETLNNLIKEHTK